MSNQENNLKETKKTRRKRSKRTAQQIKLAVIMIMVSVLVLSASTFAWYKLNNTANIEGMQFTADTLGNLQIAPTTTDAEGNTVPGEYNSILDLELADNEGNSKRFLLPATTVDGKAFYAPKYDTTGEVVEGVLESALDSENAATFDKYVYKKEFYIKSGTSETNKWYTLKLSDGVVDGSTNAFAGGTYISDKAASSHTAANAIRVSFVLGEGAYVEAGGSSGNGTVKIWEAYDNTDTEGTGTRATEKVDTQGQYGKYATITQNETGKLSDGTLCTIKEGIPVKITMYVWIEGYDDDCANEIALDTIVGQIQFVAESK